MREPRRTGVMPAAVGKMPAAVGMMPAAVGMMPAAVGMMPAAVAMTLAAAIALACFAQAVPGGRPASFPVLVQDAKSRIKEISAEEFRALGGSGQNYTLIDVREDNEWAAGHAAGAIHVGRGVLERDIEGKVPQTGARIILYCGGGFRSALAADTLQKMGYTNVASLAGGLAAYQKAGLPVER